MPEPTDIQFTQEELLSYAQGNATAFVLTAIAYLKERGLDPDEYVAIFRTLGCARLGRDARSTGRGDRTRGCAERRFGGR